MERRGAYGRGREWDVARTKRAHPPAEDGGETRRTILREAHRLFMELGYRAVSTRQIADACGLTQPALYHHFADKQDLYVAMLRDNLDTVQGGLERIARRDGDIGKRLRQVARYLPATRSDMGQMFHDIDHEVGVEARRTLEEAFHQGVVAPIAAIFADGLQRGLLRDPRHGAADPVTATFLLLSMLRYAPAGEDRQTTTGGHARHADTVVDVLLHGLAVPASSHADARHDEDRTGTEESGYT